MKKKLAAAVLAATIGVGMTAAPAQAHYDPWTTHWHYDYAGRPTYKMCSWWDKVWGCQDEHLSYGPIVLR